LQGATTTSGYRGIFEDRRSAYGQSLVLLNNTSHDEQPYADSWQALIRFATCATNDGAPMVMYGQEIGAGQKFQESQPQGAFDWYELNFGKNIPHFKKWNSMQPQWTAWDANALGVQFLYPVYSGIAQARQFSPALRSSNRWFLNRHADNNPNQEIFAVAKYEQPNVSAAIQDVVLAFTNLDRNTARSDVFGIPAALADLMGLADGRTYNVRNIAAYLGRNNEHPDRRDQWLWGTNGFTRSQLTGNGVFVALNPVPTTNAAWDTTPYEAQFLKLYDVTPLPPVAAPPVSPSYALDGSVTFSWSAVTDPGGLVPLYRLTVTRSDAVVQVFETTTTSQTVTGIPIGVSATATVTVLNPNDPSIASAPTAASVQTLSITSAADDDGDGMTNAEESIAGTHPLDHASVFAILTSAFGENSVSITVSAVPGRIYQIETSTTLEPGSWQPHGAPVTANAATAILEAPIGPEDRKFYRVGVTAP
jgi:hypothetical protein